MTFTIHLTESKAGWLAWINLHGIQINGHGRTVTAAIHSLAEALDYWLAEQDAHNQEL